MKVLVITDVQHDFMPGGALGVPHANEIIPVINALIPHYPHVVATLDWHPPNHMSFAPVGPWPVHCVKDTHGAHLATGLHKQRIEATFHKGTDPNKESYSVFSSGIEDYLRMRGLDELHFVGVATDYCVLYSVLDALKLGFKVTVIRAGCRAIGDEEKAFGQMANKGAIIY